MRVEIDCSPSPMVVDNVVPARGQRSCNTLAGAKPYYFLLRWYGAAGLGPNAHEPDQRCSPPMVSLFTRAEGRRALCGDNIFLRLSLLWLPLPGRFATSSLPFSPFFFRSKCGRCPPFANSFQSCDLAPVQILSLVVSLQPLLSCVALCCDCRPLKSFWGRPGK